jgi:hypothetical protein
MVETTALCDYPLIALTTNTLLHYIIAIWGVYLSKLQIVRASKALSCPA